MRTGHTEPRPIRSGEHRPLPLVESRGTPVTGQSASDLGRLSAGASATANRVAAQRGDVTDSQDATTLDRLPDLDPSPEETVSEEVAVTDDVLVKAFALGPGASLPPHDHPGSTNVFHVLRGTPTVIQDDDEETVEAPGVVVNERGAVHGLRNDGDDAAVVTASFSPPPG